jgi:hypothetical protein
MKVVLLSYDNKILPARRRWAQYLTDINNGILVILRTGYSGQETNLA